MEEIGFDRFDVMPRIVAMADADIRARGYSPAFAATRLARAQCDRDRPGGCSPRTRCRCSSSGAKPRMRSTDGLTYFRSFSASQMTIMSEALRTSERKRSSLRRACRLSARVSCSSASASCDASASSQVCCRLVAVRSNARMSAPRSSFESQAVTENRADLVEPERIAQRWHDAGIGK